MLYIIWDIKNVLPIKVLLIQMEKKIIGSKKIKLNIKRSWYQKIKFLCFKKPDSEDIIKFVMTEIHFMVSLWKPWLWSWSFCLETVWAEQTCSHFERRKGKFKSPLVQVSVNYPLSETLFRVLDGSSYGRTGAQEPQPCFRGICWLGTLWHC